MHFGLRIGELLIREYLSISFLTLSPALRNQNGPWISNSEPADREEEVETFNSGMLVMDGLELVLPAFTLLESSMALFS